MTRLHIESLNVEREGRPVLSGLDMNLPRGTFLAVEGRSGSGKTSLLTCLAGMLEPPPRHRQVLLHRAAIGVAPQTMGGMRHGKKRE